MTLHKNFFCLVAALLMLYHIHAQPTNQSLKTVIPASAKNKAFIGKEKIRGVLKVHPRNPRYFTDRSGRLIYLTGSHTWLSVMDGTGPSGRQFPEDNSFLDFILQHGHNFTRLWTMDNDSFIFSEVFPTIYLRTGPGLATDNKPRFDMNQFNPAYFERLRSRVKAAYERGIYVAVVFFGHAGNLTRATYFKKENNINGVDGDPDGNGYAIETRILSDPAVTALQNAYVKKVIETVNDFDNVLFEIACESGPETTEWQYHLIKLVKEHEAKLPKQHLVGMSSDGGSVKGDDTERLFKSDAEWICPGWNSDTSCIYMTDPPAATGEKIIMVDTDHLWGIGGGSSWVWKSFLRGLQPNYMDPYVEYDSTGTWGNSQERFDSARRAMGITLTVASQVDLVTLVPHNELASTQYCLADPGKEYLVYLPEGGEAKVDLSAVTGTLNVQWVDPVNGKIFPDKRVNGGTRVIFKPPFSGDAVLFITKKNNRLTDPVTSK